MKLDFKEPGKVTIKAEIPNIELITTFFQINQLVTNFIRVLKDQKENF